MQRGRVWPTIDCGDANKSISWIDFGVFDKDIEVAILCKDARVDELVLRRITPTTTILLYQISIRKGTLWIFVKGLHVRVCRCTVKVVVVLLYVLAMIALRACQPEEPLFDNGVCS